MKHIIAGTAGHIDHGKTALVKALTGIDADRLEEEKRRGITIDLGFAHLELGDPSGEIVRIGFVDVPGHERFVRNMLAGIGGIDLVLLVIAADESIKPQTREHFDICRLLRIPRGIVVLTKADLADADTRALVMQDVADLVKGSFLESAPVIEVSATTGAGLDALRAAIVAQASVSQRRPIDGPVRLPIDRAFTMKGFGTVVTGTLVSGKIAVDEELRVEPGNRRVKVRGIQVHGRAATEAVAGQRTALRVRTVASTTCTVSASCGRCTGTIWAYRGSANRRLRNSNLVGDWTSAICRSVTWARQSSGRPAPGPVRVPGMPIGPRTRCGSPSMISMA
jgi:selenocysteine-specific elongation factor